VPHTQPDYKNSTNEADSSQLSIKEKANILIVEDNHINQIVLKSMLQRLNLQTFTADHGGKALSMIEELYAKGEQVDLILMDCQMPVMDGFETTRSIRNSHKAYANVPIVAVTANALSGDKERCLQCGMNDYLSKPFQLADIRSKLQVWLAQPNNNLAATNTVTNS
jgi:CheY-like chemotaxis protein